MANAVYAGSFDPVTKGHASVIEKAAKAFDKLFVLVAENPNKQRMFTPLERIEMILSHNFPLNVKVESYAGLVVEYAKKRHADILIRGVRDETDFSYEAEMANINKMFAPDIQTVFIPADKTLQKISSSALKQLAYDGSDLTQYCNSTVVEYLANRIKVDILQEGQ